MNKEFLYIGSDFTMFTTWNAAANFHAHYTGGVVLSLDPTQEFAYELPGGERVSGRSVFFPPNLVHRIIAPGVHRLIVQVEPESRAFRRAVGQPGPGGAVLIDRARFAALESSIGEVARGETVCSNAQALAQAVFETAAKQSPGGAADSGSPADLDERVARTCRYLRSLEPLPERITLEELAGRVNLSSERFRHLFKAERGLPVTRYILWLRVRCASLLMGEGITLTEAAHRAGFFDSAHMSRVFKTMFGVPPSQLLRNTEHFETRFCSV